MIRNCDWDHETVPYVPKTPCLLFYLVPNDQRPRVAVPNCRGEYTTLVPGMPYVEMENFDPLCLLEYSPPPLSAERLTNVVWTDLPAPPYEHLKHYLERG